MSEKKIEQLEAWLGDLATVLAVCKAMSDPKDPEFSKVRSCPPPMWAELHKLQERAIIGIAGHLSDWSEKAHSALLAVVDADGSNGYVRANAVAAARSAIESFHKQAKEGK